MENLNECGGCIGGSIVAPFYGIPVYWGGDLVIVGDLNSKISDQKNYYGYTIALGVGVPGVEVHAGQSYTKTEGNIINVIDVIVDLLYDVEKKEGLCNE